MGVILINNDTVLSYTYELYATNNAKKNAVNAFLGMLDDRRQKLEQSDYAVNPYAFFEKRIKSYDSTIEKFKRNSKGRDPESLKDVLDCVHDIYSSRIIVYYINEVYKAAEFLSEYAKVSSTFRILDKTYTDTSRTAYNKDYVAHPKPTGYASLHLACELYDGSEWFEFEIQIRTIMMHVWSHFDWVLRYKKAEDQISEATKSCLRILARLLKSVDKLMMFLRDHASEEISSKIPDDMNIIADSMQKIGFEE